MNKPTIYFDVDGVLLDWQVSFAEYCAAQTGRVITKADFQKCTDYGLQSTGLFESKEEFFDLLVKHEQSEQFANLPTLVSANWLYLLKQEGYRLAVLTAGGGSDAKTRLARRQNLAQNFPAIFDAIHFLPYNGKKDQFITSRHSPNDLPVAIVEDKSSTLEECYFYGIRTFGIRDFHNRELENRGFNFLWFNTAAEVCMHIADNGVEYV